MADVEKISGFKALDGGIYSTYTKALDASTAYRVNQALLELADGVKAEDIHVQEIGGRAVIYCDSLGEWLIANQDRLLQALNKRAMLKAPAGSRKKSAAKEPARRSDEPATKAETF